VRLVWSRNLTRSLLIFQMNQERSQQRQPCLLWIM
jgi:ACT domain.